MSDFWVGFIAGVFALSCVGFLAACIIADIADR